MKASFRVRGLLVGAFAILAVEARAQSVLVQGTVPEGLAPGMRVRLNTGAGLRFTGRVLSTDESSLSVVDGRGVALKLGREQLASIEVGIPRSRTQGALRGAARGAVIMGVLGGVVYAVDQANKRDDGLCGDIEMGISTCTTGSDVVMASFGGSLIGAAIGAIAPGDRWQTLRPESFRLGVGRARGGGVAVRVAMSF